MTFFFLRKVVFGSLQPFLGKKATNGVFCVSWLSLITPDNKGFGVYQGFNSRSYISYPLSILNKCYQNFMLHYIRCHSHACIPYLSYVHVEPLYSQQCPSIVSAKRTCILHSSNFYCRPTIILYSKRIYNTYSETQRLMLRTIYNYKTHNPLGLAQWCDSGP
jgi:hypothetical protein